MTFTRSEITDGLVRYLREFAKGTRITYAELTKHFGMPFSAQESHLVRARHILRNEGQDWVCLPTLGLQRNSDAGIEERVRNGDIPGVRRKARRGLVRIKCVDPTQLDARQQLQLGVSSVQLTLTVEATKRSTRERLKVSGGNSNDMPRLTLSELALLLAVRPRRTPPEKE